MLLNAKPELLFYHNVKKYSLQVEPYAWKVICQGGIERRRSSVYHRHERCFGLQHHFAAFPNVVYDFMEFESSWKVDSVGVIQRVSTRSNMNILFDASSLPIWFFHFSCREVGLYDQGFVLGHGSHVDRLKIDVLWWIRLYCRLDVL